MNLYIIGAGNVGGYLAYHVPEMGNYDIKGFLDEDKSKHGENFYELDVLGGLELIEGLDFTIAVAIAIANPIVKQKIVSFLKKNPNITFPNFIHPTAWIGSKVSFGQGNIIYPGVVINYESRLGDFCTINLNSTIGHNCFFHNYVTLSPGVNLGGFTKVKDGCFIGIGASTLQGIEIGKHTTVGGMTMVLKHIPDHAVVIGVPGKILKSNR